MTPTVDWTEQHYLRCCCLPRPFALEAGTVTASVQPVHHVRPPRQGQLTGTAASVEPVVNPPDTPPRRVRPHNNDDGGRYRTDRARGHRQEGQ